MESVSLDTLNTFAEITGFDVVTYLSDFNTFVNENYTKIVSFYSGNSKSDKESFNKLERLINETNKLHSLININVENLPNYEYWVLVDTLSDIRTKIETINNISVWLRSSIKAGDYKKDAQTIYTLTQNETLESVSRNVVNDNQPWNNWAAIALENSLNEEDYTSKGDVALKIASSATKNYNIQSVVDNLTPQNIYGRDIKKKIEFDTFNQDLAVLIESDTLMQSIDILANLKTGNNPQYPNEGIVKDLVVGQPMSQASYPSLIRQLQANFSTDDTIQSVVITDILKDSDTVGFTYEVTTVIEEIINEQKMKV